MNSSYNMVWVKKGGELNRESMSETVHIFYCQTNVASGCVIISKTIHMSLFFFACRK